MFSTQVLYFALFTVRALKYKKLQIYVHFKHQLHIFYFVGVNLCYFHSLSMSVDLTLQVLAYTCQMCISRVKFSCHIQITLQKSDFT
jgi:hypothetical protein